MSSGRSWQRTGPIHLPPPYLLWTGGSRGSHSRPELNTLEMSYFLVDCVWNVMSHVQKPDFVFRRNGRVHLNGWGRQFIRLLAAEVCASAVVMLDTPCSEVLRRVLATHSIRQFLLHLPSHASPCAIKFQLDSTYLNDFLSQFGVFLYACSGRIRGKGALRIAWPWLRQEPSCWGFCDDTWTLFRFAMPFEYHVGLERNAGFI
jgi:hypothetical protein